MQSDRAAALLGGGTAGNERLTTIVSLVLLVLLAVIGITILRIGQLIWVHLFVGLLLLGPVAAKLASTGYRFARYYTRAPAYRRKGPPEPVLRLIAPVVMISTAVVFASGIVLMFLGPRDRGQWLSIHKVSFFVWLALTGVHVLGHLPSLGPVLRASQPGARDARIAHGAAGRWLALAGALVGGLVLAIVLLPQFASWTAHGAFPHHHHGG
ncbi:MAG: hypothetical protein DLM64_14385 [Solirubrobacterales bacterium]|nr:MAG: hypothetical protein DLM64_14385 [Solirubrobacterales bacterium]